MQGREILVAVTGGIAAYKTATLVSRLVQRGASVSVMMTRSAEQFVGAATFSALTNRPVALEVFDGNSHPLGAHIELTRAAELLCVVPASANFMAKASQGLADDLISTAYLAFQGPVVIAPAMNTQMWNHPAVQRNYNQLQQDGVLCVPPGEGWLSCRDQGSGRMAEPEQILEFIEQHIFQS
jgi:phosphopantothenoylcysteine decarboxylase